MLGFEIADAPDVCAAPARASGSSLNATGPDHDPPAAAADGLARRVEEALERLARWR